MRRVIVADLQTRRLLLRPPGPGDASAIAAFYRRNRAHLTPWEPARTAEFFTAAGQRTQIESLGREMRAGRVMTWWLHEPGQAHWIGMVSLSGIIWGAFRSAYLGYKLGETDVGRGLMREALQGVIAHAFEVTGLHRIEANIMPRNQRSLAVVESLGFVSEGLARRYLQINDVWEDHVHMVLLNEPNHRADGMPET